MSRVCVKVAPKVKINCTQDIFFPHDSFILLINSLNYFNIQDYFGIQDYQKNLSMLKMWYKENKKRIRYISPNFANWLVLKVENVLVDVIASNLEQKTTSLDKNSLLEMSFGTFDKMT